MMAATSQELLFENQTDRDPLLMEQQQDHENHEHTIDIVKGGGASSSTSSNDDSSHDLALPLDADRQPSSSVQVLSPQSSSSSLNGSNSIGLSTSRRGDELGHQQRSRLSIWFIIEFIFTVSQIIASLAVLSVSQHEKPQAPLFTWVVGYVVGCTANIPVIYWRYIRRRQSIQPISSQSREGSHQQNSMLEPNPYITISLAQSSEEGDHQGTSAIASVDQPTGPPNARLNGLMEHLKMALDCFFAVWFVVGNIWIFGGHSSSSEAPNLYRLCIVLLTISCIGYAMPFILCGIICCCLPCIISFLGHEDLNQIRGATSESINALPAYKFKLKRTLSGSNRENNMGFEGVVAAGTEKERAISGEDAVCCICLATYADNDELRELPCSHFFHTLCVDKWLKINATCPLCKFEIGESNGDSPSGESTVPPS